MNPVPDHPRPMPYFHDDGVAGTWLECILNSPCLKVADYVGRESTDALASRPPLSFLHGPEIERG